MGMHLPLPEFDEIRLSLPAASYQSCAPMKHPKLAFLAVPLVLVLCAASGVHAQWWNPNDRTDPKYRGTQFEKKVTYTHRTVSDAHMSAGGAFWNDDFAKLDRMYEEFLRDHLRATDGTWLVQAIGDTFNDLGSSNPALVDKAFAHWAAKSPQSKLRPVAEAVLWQARAWAARGGGGASSVPGESMQIFRQRLVRATKALQDSEAVGKDSPLWYWAALIVAGSSGRPAEELDAIFEEAVKRFPTYQPLYYTRMNYLLPQWGGSWEQVDSFVRESAKRTQDTEGDAFYTWLYLDVGAKVWDKLFTSTNVSWPEMKKGFQDMIARHPDVWNRNVYATFACRVRDRETTATLLAQLGSSAALGAWSPGVTTESCRRFALTGI